jgi:glycosyltransferase involved in cell wall biosynthesis
MRRLQPRLSDRVICISRAVRDNFGKLPERMAGKLVILHDGIDLALFNGQQASGDGARSGQQVGMVARINAIKGHKTFIESAGLVAREIPGARFSIVGGCLPVYEPLKRELLTIAQHVGLDGRLRFLGQLEPEQVRDFMAHLDVLVMPTLIPEGFGLVMVEAMAMGKPVVATAHGGPLDVIRHGIDGLLVPPGNAAAMAEAIRYLLDSPRLRLAMGTAARHRAVELFSIQRQVEGLYRVYEQLVCH